MIPRCASARESRRTPQTSRRRRRRALIAVVVAVIFSALLFLALEPITIAIAIACGTLARAWWPAAEAAARWSAAEAAARRAARWRVTPPASALPCTRWSRGVTLARFVAGQRPPTVRFSVERRDRRLRGISIGHLHECESAR